MTRALALGLLLWGVLFAVASVLYPWSVAAPRVFKSVIVVVMASVTTCVAIAYLRDLEGRILGRALFASMVWPLMCVTLDLVILMVRPPRLSIREYMADVGLTYLIVPVIVLGLAYQRLRFERSSFNSGPASTSRP